MRWKPVGLLAGTAAQADRALQSPETGCAAGEEGCQLLGKPRFIAHILLFQRFDHRLDEVVEPIQQLLQFGGNRNP
jgi:hypothetical protein